jgi:hypothetical protein
MAPLKQGEAAPANVQRGRQAAALPERISLHISRDGEAIPVTVRVQWTDGTEGEVNGWTNQWTRAHVCVYRETGAAVSPALGAGLRCQAAIRRMPGVNAHSCLQVQGGQRNSHRAVQGHVVVERPVCRP